MVVCAVESRLPICRADLQSAGWQDCGTEGIHLVPQPFLAWARDGAAEGPDLVLGVSPHSHPEEGAESPMESTLFLLLGLTPPKQSLPEKHVLATTSESTHTPVL